MPADLDTHHICFALWSAQRRTKKLFGEDRVKRLDDLGETLTKYLPAFITTWSPGSWILEITSFPFITSMRIFASWSLKWSLSQSPRCSTHLSKIHITQIHNRFSRADLKQKLEKKTSRENCNHWSICLNISKSNRLKSVVSVCVTW